MSEVLLNNSSLNQGPECQIKNNQCEFSVKKSIRLNCQPNAYVSLKCKKEFSNVFDNTSLKAANKSFVALAVKTNGTAVKLGLVIQKKKARRAVDRNYLKRAIRESLRHLPVQHFNALQGYDVVILLRHSDEVAVALKHKKAVYASLQHLWKKLARKAISP